MRRGERVRLRVINAAADTMFALSVDDHPLTLVASDGQAVEPVKTDAVLVGMGERADLLLEATRPGAYRIVALPLGKTAAPSRRCATPTRRARRCRPCSRR